MSYAPLHTPITNAQRIALIARYPLARVLSAPGHRTLRNPAAVDALADALRAGRLQPFLAEPILLGLFTMQEEGAVRLRAVECIDGHHRLLAGLKSGVWRVIRDIPEGAVDTRVNGWRADGEEAEPRWIPLEVAQRSTLPRDAWSVVPPQWGAKGPTAMIPGAVCGLDPVFAEQDRSVPLSDLLRRV
ncbi:MAG: hypothetical protein GC206_16230 [Alphaproteobacteria bacterium]|nr:hypothetical protein [Alphaproteobacteria bacterium]